MARLVRPLRQWPPLQQRCCSSVATPNAFLTSPSPSVVTEPSLHCLSFIRLHTSRRSIHHRPHGLRLRDCPAPLDLQEDTDGGDYDSDSKKSRNQKKSEARRAVRWGMELASFSTSQIKRILRAASLEEDVLDALALVKRLGPDVREGKRRQFNYIGKLLRDVEPELMDTLIRATKEGDLSTLQSLADPITQINEDEDWESEDTETEEEEEDSPVYIDIASRWFDGLISKDVKITNEVYSVHTVDFDRQELRKLVRRVHASPERQDVEKEEREGDPATVSAKKSLTRFLRGIAKRMPNDNISL